MHHFHRHSSVCICVWKSLSHLHLHIVTFVRLSGFNRMHIFSSLFRILLVIIFLKT